MFVAPERIIVGGKLAAYKGESMLDDVAKKRGIDIAKYAKQVKTTASKEPVAKVVKK